MTGANAAPAARPTGPTFSDVLAAAERLGGVVHRTPVMTSRTLDEAAGCQVFLKCENFQRVGAFKFRGAYNTLCKLSEQERAVGVITYSSGNHAQAVAYAAELLGINATVVMPADAPPIKLAATRGYGAEVITYDPEGGEEREMIARRIQAERGQVMVPPFDHPDVIAGQGTATLELLQEVEGLDAMLAPCGGGGSLSGAALVVKHELPHAKVIGVEPQGSDCGSRAFRSGRIETVAHPTTMADGLKPKALGEHTFAVIRSHVDEMLTVSEEQIRVTLDFLWNRMKMVVEPSGAVALAPLLHRKAGLEGRRVGVLITGGNADIAKVADWLRMEGA
ncbi:MAG: threo-3-hydroxy-L-aspartate ammonia-lyase [SAR324 cluster bacterium]|nr:threo-3-hydroxy-L-aspartate ammonia-lyase [SAR324 cluster bacterium]